MNKKNKHILKPLLAVFLAAVLLFGGVPAAYADDIEVDTEAELGDALAAAADGDTVRLTADIGYNGIINITDKQITLDLDTYNLNITNAGIGLNLLNGGVVLAGAGTLNVTSTGSQALRLTNGHIEFAGTFSGSFNVTGLQSAVYASSGSSAAVTGATSTGANYYCLNVIGGSTVEVRGDVEGAAGISTSGGTNDVHVAGDVYAVGTGIGGGINVISPGATVIVDGGVYSSLSDYGVRANGAGTSVHAGSVTADGSCGVYATDNAVITIDGNVTAATPGAIGAEAGWGGRVTIDGDITADGYVTVNGVAKGAADRTAPTTKLGYATYSDGADPDTVWVKAPNFDFRADPDTISAGGGGGNVYIEGVDLPDGITITAFEGATPAITGITDGDDTQQAVSLTFPGNIGDEDIVYTVRPSLDGGASWDENMSATVTVEKDDSGPGGGGPGITAPIIVTTGAISGITASEATFSGSAWHSLGVVTERGFVYGTSTDSAINTKVPEGSGMGDFTMTVSSLLANTEYHVRAYAANNSSGTEYGEDMVFTTLPATPAPDPDDTGSGSRGGGSATNASQRYYAIVTENKVQVDTLPVTVSSETKIGTVSLTGAKAKKYFTPEGNIFITVPSIPGVKSLSLEMPANSLSGTQAENSLTFKTPYGGIAISDGMLSAFTGAENKKTGIIIGQGDKTGLADAVKTAVGDRPVIQLTLKLDGKQTDWNNPAAPVTAAIPYAPTADELANPESIVVWYLDGSGNAVSVPNGQYDPDTGTVIVDITHFSNYAVTYNKVSFNDVVAASWYHKAVSFIAARDITTGTGGGNFSPMARLTRGEFLVMLMKSYEIAPDVQPQDNFSDAGNAWYTGYLAEAKRLGISGGTRDNLFAPNKEITRQEMFTLLYNALRAIGQLPRTDNGGSESGNTGKSLSDFSDAEEIASWAEDAMALLTKTGTVSGSGGKLAPEGTATRAEMAQLLYNLLTVK